MSQFGVMFFADPVAAFENIRRHLRPGGRLAFASWQPLSVNTWYPGAIIAKYLPAPPPPAATGGPAPGPFAFGDPAYVEGILTGAGFRDVRCEPIFVEVAAPATTIHDREMLRERGLDAAQQDAAWGELQAMAASLRGPDGLLHLRLAPLMCTAVNAG
jgi:SAM-dependent methyltransferase